MSEGHNQYLLLRIARKITFVSFCELLQSDNIYSLCPRRSELLVRLSVRKKGAWIIYVEQIMYSEQQKGAAFLQQLCQMSSESSTQ